MDDLQQLLWDTEFPNDFLETPLIFSGQENKESVIQKSKTSSLEENHGNHESSTPVKTRESKNRRVKKLKPSSLLSRSGKIFIYFFHEINDFIFSKIFMF